MWVRWAWTVRGETNSRAATSLLPRPALTSLTTSSSARVSDPQSGRVMEVRTTEPGLQLYTGNHLRHGGLCFETQHFPDSVNQPDFPSTILRPGQTFKSTTAFAFSVLNR